MPNWDQLPAQSGAPQAPGGEPGPAEGGWQSLCALVCGALSCLTALAYLFMFRADLSQPSVHVLGILQSPNYYVVFLLALGAEVFSHDDMRLKKRADFLAARGMQPARTVDAKRISRARAGRRLGRLAVLFALLLVILTTASFFHALRESG